MRLAFSTNAFVRFSVIEALERIASLGYEGVEILADTPHLYASSASDSDLERLKVVLERCGLAVANLNANTAMGYYGRTFWEPLFEPSLANPDQTAREWRVAYSKRCIDLAGILGCQNVSLTSGRLVPGCAPEDALKYLRDSLETVVEYAERAGVRIGIEYEPGLLVERCQELQALIEAVGSPCLGANLDLGHSHILGEDPETVIASLFHRIHNIHLEDIRGQKHYHLIPGSGEIDFGRLLRILRNHGYDGFITVELYTYPHAPEMAARESFAYLKHLMANMNEVTS